MNKDSLQKRRDDNSVDLENHFFLRLPKCASIALRQALQSGNPNLKDRLSIKFENDMRHGTVKFDNWVFSGKLFDLPAIIESHKTIDNKNLYKTADVCQILICKEEEDQTPTDEESPTKVRKKDPNKVDKKFLWPHGLTPPLKNVRKRRFRKTLKKKFIDAPEIEKEVKRLLRVDNEAVNVRWEVMNEEEESKTKNPTGSSMGVTVSGTFSNPQSSGIAEHDLFGEPVSDSDEEMHHVSSMIDEDDSKTSDSQHRINQEALEMEIDKVRDEIKRLKAKQQAHESQLALMDNPALRQRFQNQINNLKAEEREKEKQLDELTALL